MSGPPRVAFESFRLDLLLKAVATPVLVKIFERRYERSTRKTWEDGAGRCKEFLKSRTARVKGLKWQKIQKERIEDGDLTNMDLSQLGTILLKFPWTSEPAVVDLTEEETYDLQVENIYVQGLADVRNTHAHFSLSTPDGQRRAERELQECWTAAETVLLQLGGEDLKGEMESIRRLEFKKTGSGYVPILTRHDFLPATLVAIECACYAYFNSPTPPTAPSVSYNDIDDNFSEDPTDPGSQNQVLGLYDGPSSSQTGASHLRALSPSEPTANFCEERGVGGVDSIRLYRPISPDPLPNAPQMGWTKKLFKILSIVASSSDEASNPSGLGRISDGGRSEGPNFNLNRF